MKIKFASKIPIIIFKEEDQYISDCPFLKVASCGDTLKQAKENIIEAINLYIESCLEAGTLEEALVENGWEKVNEEFTIPVTREKSSLRAHQKLNKLNITPNMIKNWNEKFKQYYSKGI